MFALTLKPRAPRSITVRLAALYAVSAYAMLVVATAFLYWVLTEGIERDDLHIVADKVHRIEWILLHHPDDTALLEHEVKWDGGTLDTGQPYATYARVLDGQGRPVIETPGMGEAIPSARFPPPVLTTQMSEPNLVQDWESPEGRSFCVVSAQTRPAQGGQSWVVQVAMDDAEEEKLLAGLRHGSLGVLLLGTLFCAGMGGVVARRGMKPLRQIAVAAERITANQLHERLDLAHWPEELGVLAQALNHMLSRLEDAFARMSQCAADLAHELRTPIHNLIGEAEVALSADRTPEEYRCILESSLEEFDRLARMINEMLFLARAEDPQKVIERVPIDAREEIEAVSEFFDALSEAHGITVTNQGHGTVAADPLLFRRSLTNLLSNAMRHTPRGGRVVVSVEQAEDGAAVVKVADSGCGIPLEQLPAICDRQNCTNRDLGQCSGENGLGLSIVKSIVELHGGSIAIESALGRGTTVLLRFPAMAPALA
jgi:two-component system heavy metal sensor histidine kinase CusS